jgi:hypothetical protein
MMHDVEVVLRQARVGVSGTQVTRTVGWEGGQRRCVAVDGVICPPYGIRRRPKRPAERTGLAWISPFKSAPAAAAFQLRRGQLEGIIRDLA